MLAAGAVPAVKIQEEAATRGISEATLKRAKSQLYVKSVREGDAWHWDPPAWMQTHQACSVNDSLDTLDHVDTLDPLEMDIKGIKGSRDNPPQDDTLDVPAPTARDLLAAMTTPGARQPGDPFQCTPTHTQEAE